MPDTFCSVWIHYVFSTKNREPWVVPAVRARLWPYFAAIAKQSIARAARKALYLACSNLPCETVGTTEERRELRGFRCETF